MDYDYIIIGAGFTGCVLAERIATCLGKKILIIEKRDHIGGNCYDYYDYNGILIHKYGPHIFHTNSKSVYDYLSEFSKWRIYKHKVVAFYKNDYYPIPINNLTINKFFKIGLSDEKSVKKFLKNLSELRFPVRNSEDIIVNQVGKELFEAFFKNFTKKQWLYYPSELSPNICGRIKVRYDNNCYYFTDKFQVMPSGGYHLIFNNLIDNKNIELILNTDYKKIIKNYKYKHLIYTGPIDYFYDFKYGKLPYRSIKFVNKSYNKDMFQNHATINYVGSEEYSRISEFKIITGQKSKNTSICIEYPQKDGEALYPTFTLQSQYLIQKYLKLAMSEKNVIFAGRLATFKYYNMDQVILKALNIFKTQIDYR